MRHRMPRRPQRLAWLRRTARGRRGTRCPRQRGRNSGAGAEMPGQLNFYGTGCRNGRSGKGKSSFPVRKPGCRLPRAGRGWRGRQSCSAPRAGCPGRRRGCSGRTRGKATERLRSLRAGSGREGREKPCPSRNEGGAAAGGEAPSRQRGSGRLGGCGTGGAGRPRPPDPGQGKGRERGKGSAWANWPDPGATPE